MYIFFHSVKESGIIADGAGDAAMETEPINLDDLSDEQKAKLNSFKEMETRKYLETITDALEAHIVDIVAKRPENPLYELGRKLRMAKAE